ncbi:MAG: hypothetical protein IJQ02_02640, partial [Oscillospiraceae bacterium]|nr:hypothetical protein [Oscillospiraceae bacterium]
MKRRKTRFHRTAIIISIAAGVAAASLFVFRGGWANALSSPEAIRAAVEAEKVDLLLPAITETDCEWNERGNLIRETTHDENGKPALNARGFQTAEYTWDERGNLLTEAFYGLKGELVDTDRGYARSETTWYTDEKGGDHVLTIDRYAADGSRADIPG